MPRLNVSRWIRGHGLTAGSARAPATPPTPAPSRPSAAPLASSARRDIPARAGWRRAGLSAAGTTVVGPSSRSWRASPMSRRRAFVLRSRHRATRLPHACGSVGGQRVEVDVRAKDGGHGVGRRVSARTPGGRRASRRGRSRTPRCRCADRPAARAPVRGSCTRPCPAPMPARVIGRARQRRRLRRSRRMRHRLERLGQAEVEHLHLVRRRSA